MKKTLLIAALSVLFASVLSAQTLQITSPSGLEPPYEVSPGTSVTVLLQASISPTSFFTNGDSPVFPDFGKDDTWNELQSFVDNGDGTYSLTLTVNEPVFLWAGSYSSWTSLWQFSDVIEIGIASGVKISSADEILCNASGDSEILSAQETFEDYQWYFNNELIEGATDQTLSATQPGYYKVKVPLDGHSVFSNTLNIKVASISFTGVFENNQLKLQAPAGFSPYQWFKGPSENSLTAIGGATGSGYTPVLSAQIVYYAVQGAIAGCTVKSSARAASGSMFVAPVISVNASLNGYGKLCIGSEAELIVSGSYGTYKWYNNGEEYYGESGSITVFDATGPFQIKTTSVAWPEVVLTSASVSVPYFSVLQPQLSGVQNYSVHCPGENLKIELSDEGYTYEWYMHTSYNYDVTDKVEVAGLVYSFDFPGATYITVVAKYMGCESSKRLYLDGYENQTVFLEVDDYDQQYLCPGKAVLILIPESEADDYQNFQWYKLNEGSPVIISGQTVSSYSATSPGKYLVTAQPKSCPVSSVSSLPHEIYSYTQRELFPFADRTQICLGEETTLFINGDWINPQWFRKEIRIGSSGYEEIYTPVPESGTDRTLVVSSFNSYVVKAKHASCPTGLKTTSHPIQISPQVNPTISVSPFTQINEWHKAPYDSIASYLFCESAPATLTLDGEYSSYKWFKLDFSGDSRYALGEEIPGQNTNKTDVIADGATWYTAQVESGGCTGFSDPIIIDTWVHNLPDVEVFNNGEICGEGNSTLLRLAFPGNWVKYEWYKNSVALPDSDNDSLVVTTPGLYNVTGFPSECPHIGYSSGTPAEVNLFPKATIGENDTIIYAFPEYGFYHYQWYRDGEPIESEEYPWILHKNNMPSGTYTVQVTNPEPCSSISDGFLWLVTAVDENPMRNFGVHPNPTTGVFSIKGIESKNIERVRIFNPQGQVIFSERPGALRDADLSGSNPGVYIIEVTMKDGTTGKTKIVRQ